MLRQIGARAHLRETSFSLPTGHTRIRIWRGKRLLYEGPFLQGSLHDAVCMWDLLQHPPATWRLIPHGHPAHRCLRMAGRACIAQAVASGERYRAPGDRRPVEAFA